MKTLLLFCALIVLPSHVCRHPKLKQLRTGDWLITGCLPIGHPTQKTDTQHWSIPTIHCRQGDLHGGGNECW